MDMLTVTGVGSTTAVAVGISHRNSVLLRSAPIGSLILRKPISPANSLRIPRRPAAAAVRAEAAIDLSDPDWKVKYERDFEERFNITHITDVFPDAEAIRSTFCLKMRSLIPKIPMRQFLGHGLMIVFFFFCLSPVGLRRQISPEVTRPMKNGTDTLITKTECFSRYIYFLSNDGN